MREIGGAVAVAAASTVLIGGTESGTPTSAAARQSLLDTFRSAFLVIAIFAVIGGILAVLGLVGRARAAEPEPELEPELLSVSGGNDD